MKNILLLMSLVLLTAFPAYSSFNISTTLVIVEEIENDKIPEEKSPFSDGIMEALWEKPYIFFDMKLKEPIKMYKGKIDMRPYIESGNSSGADSILLVKLNYEAVYEKNKDVRVKIESIHYTLYSLTELKALVTGKKILKLDRYIGITEKPAFMKRLGKDLLNEIYQGK